MNIEDFITYIDISIFEPRIYKREIFDKSIIEDLKLLVVSNVNFGFQFIIKKQNSLEYAIYGHLIEGDLYSIVWAPKNLENIKQEAIYVKDLPNKLEELLNKVLI